MRYLVFLFIFFSTSIRIDAQSLMDNAQIAYEKKDYKKAIKIYEGIISENPQVIGIHYNLANNYYLNGDISKAILNYEKALLHYPNNKDIIRNLTIANDKIENPISDINNFFLSQWYQSLYKSNHLVTLSIFLFLFVLLLLTLVYIVLYKNLLFFTRYKWIIASLLMILIITCYQLVQHRSLLENGSHGIIMNNTSLYSGADIRSQVLHEIDSGIKVQVIDSIGTWYKMSLPDKEQGWMEKSSLEIIK